MLCTDYRNTVSIFTNVMPFLGVVNGRVLSCAIPKNSTRPLSTARVPPPHRDRSGQAWRACCSGFPLARECAEHALAKPPRTRRYAVPRARRHRVAATTDRSRILSRYPFVSADRSAPSRMPHSTPRGGGSDSSNARVLIGRRGAGRGKTRVFRNDEFFLIGSSVFEESRKVTVTH